MRTEFQKFLRITALVAERVGFEPTNELPRSGFKTVFQLLSHLSLKFLIPLILSKRLNNNK